MTLDKNENSNVKWGHFIPFVIATVTILLYLGGWIISSFAQNNSDHSSIKKDLTIIQVESCERLARIETKVDTLVKQEKESNRYGN